MGTTAVRQEEQPPGAVHQEQGLRRFRPRTAVAGIVAAGLTAGGLVAVPAFAINSNPPTGPETWRAIGWPNDEAPATCSVEGSASGGTFTVTYGAATVEHQDLMLAGDPSVPAWQLSPEGARRSRA